MITAQRYDGIECVLVDADDKPIALDATLVSCGEEFTLLSASPPHKPGSTGRVYVESNIHGWKTEYYPMVFRLRWRPRSRADHAG